MDLEAVRLVLIFLLLASIPYAIITTVALLLRYDVSVTFTKRRTKITDEEGSND